MHKNKVSIRDGQFENVLAVAFAPVVALTELIKNSSDACVITNDTIKIYIDTEASTIRLIDNGYGFSRQDIEHLHEIGFSSKMRDGNTLSRIGEPFAGSKGLGILTAFNLCDRLEILTFSKEDKKPYSISWKKGTAEIEWEEIAEERNGSEFTLHGVKEETFKLLLLKEELIKLYFSSIKSCVNIKNLPQIELHHGDETNAFCPKTEIDELYKLHKKPSKGYFVAKASFKYSKNKLILSYEDNIRGVFNFQNEEINLSDLSSVINFLKKHNISGLSLRDVVAAFDNDTVVDDFSGVYYIWRGVKLGAMGEYPNGVRIYVNNYGLYNYLNSEFDWLQHSEISQNKKATNYKLKNTYGYVAFHNYNEDISSLKISNERNDFCENLAKKKFINIMRNFISAIFSSIDINIKNFDDSDRIIFKRRVNSKTSVILGRCLDISDMITTNLSCEEITMELPASVTLDHGGRLLFSQTGSCKLKFGYEDEFIEIDIQVENDTPYFELKKNSFPVPENNIFDLREQIKKGSLKNLTIGDIKISSNSARIIDGYLFAANNSPQTYSILYKYSEEISQTAQLTVKPIQSKTSDNLKKKFPYLCQRYPKITDVIYAIAESHAKHSTLCIIALRPLIEFSLKAFIAEFYPDAEWEKIRKDEKTNNSFDVNGKLDGLLQRIRNDQLASVNCDIMTKYKDVLIDTGKHISKAYKDLDLNSHIHNPNTHATPNEVKGFLNKLQPFLNFIIEALNAKTTQ